MIGQRAFFIPLIKRIIIMNGHGCHTCTVSGYDTVAKILENKTVFGVYISAFRTFYVYIRSGFSGNVSFAGKHDLKIIRQTVLFESGITKSRGVARAYPELIIIVFQIFEKINDAFFQIGRAHV